MILAWREIERYIREVCESPSAPALSESEGKCQHPLIASATRTMPNPFFFTAGRGDTSSPLRTQSSTELVQFQDPSEDQTSAMQCCFSGMWPLCISGHLELSCSCNQLLEVLFSLRLGACQGQGQKSKMFARNSQGEGVILRQSNNTLFL